MGAFENYLKMIKGCPDFRDDPEATVSLVLKMKQDDVQAKADLIKSALYFIAELAQRHCRKLNVWPYFDDMVQEGNKKVLARIINFDPEAELSLEGYIHSVARSAFFDYLHKVNVVNFTDYRRQKNREIRHAREKLSKEFKREPTVEEVADYLDMDEDKVREFITHSAVLTLDLDALADADAASNVVELSRRSRNKDIPQNNNPLDNTINSEMLEFAVECLGREEAELLIAYQRGGGDLFRDLYFRLTGKRKSKAATRQYIHRRIVKLKEFMRKKSRLSARGGDYGLHATYSK